MMENYEWYLVAIIFAGGVLMFAGLSSICNNYYCATNAKLEKKIKELECEIADQENKNQKLVEQCEHEMLNFHAEQIKFNDLTGRPVDSTLTLPAIDISNCEDVALAVEMAAVNLAEEQDAFMRKQEKLSKNDEKFKFFASAKTAPPPTTTTYQTMSQNF